MKSKLSLQTFLIHMIYGILLSIGVAMRYYTYIYYILFIMTFALISWIFFLLIINRMDRPLLVLVLTSFIFMLPATIASYQVFKSELAKKEKTEEKKEVPINEKYQNIYKSSLGLAVIAKLLLVFFIVVFVISFLCEIRPGCSPGMSSIIYLIGVILFSILFIISITMSIFYKNKATET